jgi:hypothetical protein
MMKTIELNDDQLMTLRAGWQYLTEDESATDAIAEALDIGPEDRGMDDEGDYVEGKSEEDDPVTQRIGEITTLIMSD